MYPSDRITNQIKMNKFIETYEKIKNMEDIQSDEMSEFTQYQLYSLIQTSIQMGHDMAVRLILPILNLSPDQVIELCDTVVDQEYDVKTKRILISDISHVKFNYNSFCYECIKRNKLKLVQFIFEKIDPCYDEYRNHTDFVECAIQHGHKEILKFLVPDHIKFRTDFIETARELENNSLECYLKLVEEENEVLLKKATQNIRSLNKIDEKIKQLDYYELLDLLRLSIRVYHVPAFKFIYKIVPFRSETNLEDFIIYQNYDSIKKMYLLELMDGKIDSSCICYYQTLKSAIEDDDVEIVRFILENECMDIMRQGLFELAKEKENVMEYLNSIEPNEKEKEKRFVVRCLEYDPEEKFQIVLAFEPQNNNLYVFKCKNDGSNIEMIHKDARELKSRYMQIDRSRMVLRYWDILHFGRPYIRSGYYNGLNFDSEMFYFLRTAPCVKEFRVKILEILNQNPIPIPTRPEPNYTDKCIEAYSKFFLKSLLNDQNNNTNNAHPDRCVQS